MSLLNKFDNLSVNNTKRINKNILRDLLTYSEEFHNYKNETTNQINYLKGYDSDESKEFVFKNVIDDLEDNIDYKQSRFVEMSFHDIKKFYYLDENYRDVRALIENSTLVSEIIDGVFKYYDNKPLEDVSKEQLKINFRNLWDDTYHKEMPTITKSGIINLPSFFYIYGGSKYENYLRNSNMSNIGFLERCLNLCFNGVSETDNSLFDLRAESEISDATDYVKKGSVKVLNNNIKTIQAYSNNKVKVSFVNSELANKFWEFYNMGDYKKFGE